MIDVEKRYLDSLSMAQSKGKTVEQLESSKNKWPAQIKKSRKGNTRPQSRN